MFSNAFLIQTGAGLSTINLATTELFYSISIVTFIAIAILSRRGLSLRTSKAPSVIGSIACTVGACLVTVAVRYTTGTAATMLFYIGTPLASVGLGVLTLAWYELYAGLSLDYAMLYYVAASALAGLLQIALIQIPEALWPVASMFVCISPVLSAACFALSRARISSLPYAGGEEITPRWDFPWRPVSLLTVFFLSSKVVLNLLHEDIKGYGSIAMIVCFTFLLLIIILGFKRFQYRLIRYAALPLLLAGMLCAINGTNLAIQAMALTYLARYLLLALVVALLFDLAYRRGVNPLWVFGLTLACGNAGTIAANVITNVTGISFDQHATMTAVLSVLIVGASIAYIVFADGNSLAGTWGIEPSDGKAGAAKATGAHAVGVARPADIEALCSRAARRYDLTRREEQILLMRLKGASLKDVEETLVIAHNTVKSHVRHIYAKLGVSTLDEARELVEAP